jgi:hypothetical protein
MTLTNRQESDMPEFPRCAHVAVTVTDPEAGGAWYRKLFGPIRSSTLSASASRAARTETWMDRLNALDIGHGGIVDIPGVK